MPRCFVSSASINQQTSPKNFKINCLALVNINFQVMHELNLAAQPANVFSKQMWHRLGGKHQTFQRYKNYNQEALL